MNERSMRAAVFAAPRRIEVQETPLPEPGPGQVRFRVEGCGVCGSNGPLWEGRAWFRYPMPPGAGGHEAWGVVDAVGSGVAGIAAGTRVAALSGNGFAEYDVADADSVVPLPPTLEGPFPGEAFGCGMNVFRRSAIERGQTVAVIGVGFIGAVALRMTALAGARVIAISRRPAALALATRFGAAETIPMDDHGRILERVKDLTGGRFCDRVIEAVGLQWPLDLAAELTRERGRMVIAGYHQDGPRQVNMQLWNWRGLDVINAHERDPKVYVDGIRAALDAIVSGRLDPAPLLTHAFPLERMDEAFRAAEARPEGFLKAWIRPTAGS